MIVGAGEMIAASFGSRVGTVGRVGRNFAKRGLVRTEAAIDFISGNKGLNKLDALLAWDIQAW